MVPAPANACHARRCTSCELGALCPILSEMKEDGFDGFPNNFVQKETGVLATSRNRSTLTKIARLAREA
jgi:hypothetical protein